ncbi:MAG: hypothetical protein U0R52_02615 [Solirubrobacterales bacterium]
MQKRHRFGFAALVAVALLPAAVALAAVSTHKSSVLLSPAGRGSATARCDSGERLVLGGFSTPSAGGSGISVNTLNPISGSAWLARAVNFAGPGRLTSIAYCAQVGRLTRVVTKKPVPAGRLRAIVATCPRGASVRFGGYTSSADSYVGLVGLERPSARRWKVTAYADSDGPRTVSAVAMCGKGPAPVSVARKTVTIAPDAQGTATVRCPRGRELALGGFADAPFHPRAGDEGGPYVDGLERTSPRSWTARAYSFSAGRITSIAYCR